jgi:DHA1 family bicyclomycin/chloramphenicol resistance-like MFS transporter
MYLPSLPDIGRDLAASTLQVQLTISTYLFGWGIGAIFYGPVSDRLGRRPVLLWALVFYAIITTGCAVAPSIWALITLRFVQGIAVAGAMALARAMVRDISSGVRAGQELSLMGSITGFAPIIAPVIGGGLQIWFGWRANFVALLLFGGVIGSVAALRLPETFRHPIKMPFSFVGMAAAYRSVTDHRGFLWHLAILTLGVAGLFAWLSGASFVMQSALYRLSPFAFGASLAVSSAGYVLGTLIAARAMVRFGLDFVIGIGTAVHGAWRPVNGGRYRFGLAERRLPTRAAMGSIPIRTAPQSNSDLASRPARPPASGPAKISIAKFNAQPLRPPNARTASTSDGAVVTSPAFVRNGPETRPLPSSVA